MNLLPVPIELERRPVVGGRGIDLLDFAFLVRDLDRSADELDLSSAKGFVFGHPVLEVLVEADHQLGGGAVGDLPEGREDRAGASVLKGAGESD